MDRRVEKTRKAIFEAFYNLIKKEDYSKISVQDIIDEANIGRSTFYDHFETKDDVLKTMCSELFEHIFNPSKNASANCFIDSSTLDKKILHILYHLLEKKDVIKGIFNSESEEIFVVYLRKYIDEFSVLLNDSIEGVPHEIITNHISGSFVELIRYWVRNGFKEAPENLTKYYLRLLPYKMG